MIKISASIIAKNNEQEIASCINSIKGVDEIVVLDTGSNDKTAYVASGLGARVYYYRWEDDFAAARNRCLEYTHNPWILSIDTDEILETPVEAMYNLLRENFTKKVISFPIADREKTFWGARLFRKSLCYYEGEIHEQLNRTPDLYTDEIKIWHTPSQNHQKYPMRNISILRRALEKKSTSQRDIFFLGVELHAAGQYDAALYWMQYYLQLAPRTQNYTSEVYYLMSDCYCNLHRVSRAIDCLMKAAESNPEMKCVYEKLSQLTKDEKWDEKAKTATNLNVLVLR